MSMRRSRAAVLATAAGLAAGGALANIGPNPAGEPAALEPQAALTERIAGGETAGDVVQVACYTAGSVDAALETPKAGRAQPVSAVGGDVLLVFADEDVESVRVNIVDEDGTTLVDTTFEGRAMSVPLPAGTCARLFG